MANNRNTYQQTFTVSVPRDVLVEVAESGSLNENDLRVFMMLLTQLDGFKIQDSTRGREAKDPLNYKIIDLKTISDNLCLDEKHIKKSIKKLRHDGYLEKGSNDTITKGYRFTF